MQSRVDRDERRRQGPFTEELAEQVRDREGDREGGPDGPGTEGGGGDHLPAQAQEPAAQGDHADEPGVGGDGSSGRHVVVAYPGRQVLATAAIARVLRTVASCRRDS